MNSDLSTLNNMTDVPLSKAPDTQPLLGHHINGCPLLRVCVHGVCVYSGRVNAEHEFRVWVTILAVCHVTFT